MPVLEKYWTRSYYICDRFVMSGGEFNLVSDRYSMQREEMKELQYDQHYPDMIDWHVMSKGREDSWSHILIWLNDVSWKGGDLQAVLWIQIHWIRIRIQHFKWIRIRIQIQSFDNQKLKKIQVKFFSFLFLIKNFNLFILGLHKRASQLQEKPSALKREHPALQKMTFI